jgi:two-component system, probable response regulator PhcQ
MSVSTDQPVAGTEPAYDYRRYAILYVDDEEISLKSFARAFQSHFRIFTASGARDGLKLLEQHKDEIGVLMTDQRMPGEKGVWLLEQARHLNPHIVRILVTAFADMEAAIAAVNSGAVYKYLSKPWDPPQLEGTLRRALEFHIVQRERDQFHREKLAALHSMTAADRIISLGLLAAGMSHHIRNSLVAVKTFLDLVPQKLADEGLDRAGLRHPEFWMEYHQNAREQLARIERMLRDLWSVSEKPAFRLADQVRLREVVADVLCSAAAELRTRQLTVENEIPDSLPELTVDSAKFHRLFDLLLKDEMVSLPAGSRIVFSAHALPAVDGLPARVEVQVRDNGPGLPEDTVRRLFDPFAVRTDSPMEYGINLMACFFIAHHHGGRIEVRNHEAGGSLFTLHLVTQPAATGADPGAESLIQRLAANDSAWQRLLSDRD